MDLGLTGKKALILASSRGLGLGVAKALAREGADVVMTGRNGDKLAANAVAINAEGKGKAAFIVADLFSADSVPGLLGAMAESGETIDIIVNNSGGPVPGKAEDIDAESLMMYFRSMVMAQITLTNQMLEPMKKAGWGRILTIASSGVFEPIPGLALSNVLRPALVGWSKTLSRELAPFGVTSNLLLPGSILTDRLDELDQTAANRAGTSLAEARALSEAGIPMGRYGTVEEFAATAAFLCSAPASYITGTMVRCDGGKARSV